MTDETRNITDADARQIAKELKVALMKDFQLEVGRGVIFWGKRVVILIALLLAVYGAFGDKALIASIISSK